MQLVLSLRRCGERRGEKIEICFCKNHSFFVRYLGLELNGFAISFTIKLAIEFGLLLWQVLSKIEKDYLKLPSWSDLKKDFGKEIIFIIIISVTNYFELISYFASFVIIAQFHDTNMLSAHSFQADINMYFYYF